MINKVNSKIMVIESSLKQGQKTGPKTGSIGYMTDIERVDVVDCKVKKVVHRFICMYVRITFLRYGFESKERCEHKNVIVVFPHLKDNLLDSKVKSKIEATISFIREDEFKPFRDEVSLLTSMKLAKNNSNKKVPFIFCLPTSLFEDNKTIPNMSKNEYTCFKYNTLKFLSDILYNGEVADIHNSKFCKNPVLKKEQLQLKILRGIRTCRFREKSFFISNNYIETNDDILKDLKLLLKLENTLLSNIKKRHNFSELVESCIGRNIHHGSLINKNLSGEVKKKRKGLEGREVKPILLFFTDLTVFSDSQKIRYKNSYIKLVTQLIEVCKTLKEKHNIIISK